MFVVAFTVIYALAGGSSLRARAAAAFGEQHALLLSTERFATDLRRYLIVRAKLGLFAAMLSFVLLIVLGVPFPVLWAILVFGASFIPNIGSFIAVIPPTVLAYLDSGLGAAAMVVIGYALINFAQDQFLQPVVMGSELNLSPLVVFIAVIVWAWILGAPGAPGALLAVPLTVGLSWSSRRSHPRGALRPCSATPWSRSPGPSIRRPRRDEQRRSERVRIRPWRRIGQGGIRRARLHQPSYGCTCKPYPRLSRIDSMSQNATSGVNTSAAASTPVYFSMTGAAVASPTAFR